MRLFAPVISACFLVAWVATGVIVPDDYEFPGWAWVLWILALPVAAVVGIVGIVRAHQDQDERTNALNIAIAWVIGAVAMAAAAIEVIALSLEFVFPMGGN